MSVAIHNIDVKKPKTSEELSFIQKAFNEKIQPKIKEMANKYRLQQLPKTKFVGGSMKTIKQGKHLKIKYGQLKPECEHLCPDMEGKGLFDFVKEKAKNLFSGLKSGVSKVFSTRLDDYNNTTKETLMKYGDYNIDNLMIYRTPINSMIDKALNIFSFGKFAEMKKKYGFDTFFHLALVAEVKGKNVIIEKNEVINVSTSYSTNSNTETMKVNMKNKPLTINQLLNATREKQKPDDYFSYDAFNNNCQMFIRALLTNVGLYTKDIDVFLFQNVENLIKEMPTLAKVAKTATDIGAWFNKITGEGEGQPFRKRLNQNGVEGVEPLVEGGGGGVYIPAMWGQPARYIPDSLSQRLKMGSGGGRKKLKLLELFKGTGSVGKVASKLGYDVVSVDLDPIYTPDIETDILEWDYKKFHKENNYIPDFIWASPPCNTFSPLSYRLKERDTKTAKPKSARAKIGTEILYKTLEIIKYFQKLNPNLRFTIENPRGMMRNDKEMMKLYRENTLYCLYGDFKRKSTDFWSNFVMELDGETKQCPNKTISVQDLPLNKRYSIPSKLIKQILLMSKKNVNTDVVGGGSFKDMVSQLSKNPNFIYYPKKTIHGGCRYCNIVGGLRDLNNLYGGMSKQTGFIRVLMANKNKKGRQRKNRRGQILPDFDLDKDNLASVNVIKTNVKKTKHKKYFKDLSALSNLDEMRQKGYNPAKAYYEINKEERDGYDRRGQQNRDAGARWRERNRERERERQRAIRERRRQSQQRQSDDEEKKEEDMRGEGKKKPLKKRKRPAVVDNILQQV